MLPVSDFNYIEKKGEIDFLGKIKLKILVFFAIVLTTLLSSQIVFAGNLSSDGKKLHEIKTEISNLESENLNLKSKIAQISSLTNLSQKAQAIGFNKPSEILNP